MDDAELLSVTGLASQLVSPSDVADGLVNKLDAAAASPLCGNAKAKANMLNAFTNQVRVQTGKAITARNAAILIALVARL